MRILFVLSSMPVGGLEVFTANLANNLAARGHHVTILVFRKRGMCTALVRKDCVNIVTAERDNKFSPLFLARIGSIVSDSKPEVIMSLSEFAYFFTEVVLRVLGINTPHCIRFAWSEPITRMDKIFTRIFMAFSKFWKAFYVFVSNVQKDYYSGIYRLPTQRSFLIYSGVDTDFFHPPASRCNTVFTVAHIANIRPVKDQWTLLKAMAKFDDAQKKWRLLFVGEDRYGLLSKYKELLNRARIREKVHFCVTFDRVRIKEILANSDVFVLTSLSEGLPNAPLEAMSVGIPCILTNVGGCQEVVREGFNGFLIKPGDYDTLSSRLLTLNRNRRLLLHMGHNARKRVIAMFNLEGCIDSYVQLFQRIARDN